MRSASRLNAFSIFVMAAQTAARGALMVTSASTIMTFASPAYHARCGWARRIVGDTTRSDT